MQKKIVCFGECLWDLLPEGKVAGGAPMNVGFHLQNFGAQVNMVSRIGTDELGDSLIQFLDNKGLNTNFVQRDEKYPTGVVEVSLDDKGSPSYEIIEAVAWDFIAPSERLFEIVRTADAFVFGSLACRNAKSRETLLSLIEVCPGLKIFDLNLRTPFYNPALIQKLMQLSDITKMNDEELELVGEWFLESKTMDQQLRELIHFANLRQVVLTVGASGAYVQQGDQTFYQSGFPVQVRDTVGAGDSFFAAYIHHLLEGKDLQSCLKNACATGALVATHRGGTPEINQQMIDDFIINR